MQGQSAHLLPSHSFSDTSELRAIGPGPSFEGIIGNVLPPIVPGF